MTHTPTSADAASKPAPAFSEISFTRARHASWLLLAGLVLCLITAAAAALRWKHFLYKDQTTPPPPLWLVLVPLPLAVGLFVLAWMHLRRPFLVVSRLGLEIHPLIYRETIGHITWVEAAAISSTPDQGMLTVHLNTEDETGVHITLAPLTPRARQLLMTALGRIMSFRETQTATTAAQAPPTAVA